MHSANSHGRFLSKDQRKRLAVHFCSLRRFMTSEAWWLDGDPSSFTDGPRDLKPRGLLDSERSAKDSQFASLSLPGGPRLQSTITVVVDFFPDSIDRSACRKAESVKLLPVVYNDDPRNFVTHGVNELASTILGYLIRTD